MERIKLVELDVDFEQLIRNGAAAKKSLDGLKVEAQALQKSIKDNDKVVDIYQDNLKKLEERGRKGTKQYRLQEESLKALAKTQDVNRQKLELTQTNLRKENNQYRLNQKGIDAYNKTKQREIQVVEKTDGSIKQLESALAKNKNAYRELSKEQRENEAIGGKLAKTIDKQDKEYKDLQKSIGTTQVDVGNYKGQMRELLGENVNLSNTFEQQIKRIPVVGSLFGGLYGVVVKYAKGQRTAIAATSGSAKALKIFRLALISTGIGAIVVALGSLIAAFASTQKGTDAISKALAPIKGAIQGIIGVLQNLATRLFGAFDSPKEAVLALWNTIKTNLINRITGIADTFKALGKVIASTLKLDFQAANEGLSELGESVLQMTTGVDDLPGKAAKAFNTLGEEAKKAGKQIAEAARKQRTIVDLGIAIEEAENNQIVNRAQILNQIKEEELIAKNTSLTAQERNAASERAKDLSKELLVSEQAILDKKIQQKELQNSLNDTSREEDKELQELLAQRIQKETEQLAIEMKFLSTKKALQTEIEQKRKKAVDDAINQNKAALELYIAENELKADSLKSEISVAERVRDKKLDILKQELDAKKVSQTEYEIALIEIKKEFLEKSNELTAEHLAQELDVYLAQNRSKIENDTLLTDELIAGEEARLEDIYTRKLEILEQQRESESISEQEFIAQKLELQYGYLEQQRELENEFKAQNAEQEALEYENELEIRRLRGESEFQLRYEELERQKKLEIDNAKKKGLDLQKIETKYSLKRQQISQAEQATKLAGAEAVLNGLSNLLGKETVAGKAVAVAKATIDTYKAANLALSTYPPPFGAIAAGTTIAAGFINVKKIVSTKADVPKAERGAVFDIGGNLHSGGGTKFYGEDGTAFEAERDEKLFVLNRRASAAIAPLLNDINVQYGGASLYKSRSHLAVGGSVLRNTSAPQQQGIDYDLLASKIGDANRQLPNPVVAVEDINTGQSSVAEVVQGANLGG